MRKYKLTKTKKECGYTLYQIEALTDIKLFNIKKGDKGGWVEKEDNLSQDGNAWVSGNALVFGNAYVSGNACVSGNALVFGNAWVCDDAHVSGNARVFDDVWVSGNACVSGNAWVYGHTRVSGRIKLVSILCSRFDFEFDWQVKLWQKKEKEFEQEIKRRLK